MLYQETAIFKVAFGNHETLVAEVNLNTTLHVNEMKWMILHLEPESKTAAGSSTKSKESDKDQFQPTLRLKLCLSGPYRPEIAAIVTLSNAWFQAMDGVTSATSSAASGVRSFLPHQFPSGKILLLPTVPLAALSVVFLPVLLGLLTVGLPFFLPILIVLLTVATTTLVVGTGVYLSSSGGRESAGTILGPVLSTFVSTSSGQRMLYCTGPRPSPVALAETVLPTDMVGQLVVSLVIDFIGSSSYLLPGVGEAFDVGWAPIQTILLMAMYDKTMPSLKYISFMEEILPFTDVLPSGTLGWARLYTPLVIEEVWKNVPDNVKTMVVTVAADRNEVRA